MMLPDLLLKVASSFLKKLSREEFDINWDAILSNASSTPEAIQLKVLFAELERLPHTDVENKREYIDQVIRLMYLILNQSSASPGFEDLKVEMHKLYGMVESYKTEEMTVSEDEEEQAHRKYQERLEQAREEYDPKQRKERYERRKEFLEMLREQNPELYETLKEQERGTKKEDKRRQRQDPEFKEKEKKYLKERYKRLKEEDPEKYEAMLEQQRERRRKRQLLKANEWYQELDENENYHLKVMFEHLMGRKQQIDDLLSAHDWFGSLKRKHKTFIKIIFDHLKKLEQEENTAAVV